MGDVIDFATGLFELAEDQLRRRRPGDAARTIRRLLGQHGLSPQLAAKANLLLAKTHFIQEDFAHMALAARDAVDSEPTAESHFLLATALEAYGDEYCEDALDHYRHAATLDPEDGKKKATYARRLIAAGKERQGVALLESTFAEHPSDLAVVDECVDGLLDADRVDDAELLVAQACRRGEGGGRFERSSRRWKQRIWEKRLFAEPRRPAPKARHILPFRSFSTPPTSGPNEDRPRGETGRGRRDRGPKDMTPAPDKAEPESAASIGATLKLHADLTIQEILQQGGAELTAAIHETLGLLGSPRGERQRRRIAAALQQKSFLVSLVRRLPTATRRLLRTLVRAGGFVPLAVLFQNTGPDAPPPDYAQPLVAHGLVFFGVDAKSRAKAGAPLVAMIPGDIIDRLALALNIPIEE